MLILSGWSFELKESPASKTRSDAALFIGLH